MYFDGSICKHDQFRSNNFQIIFEISRRLQKKTPTRLLNLQNIDSKHSGQTSKQVQVKGKPEPDYTFLGP